MRLCVALALALLTLGSAAHAQVHGVAVQVSGGKRVPTTDQLKTVLKPGDFVRDVLGWHRVDKKCNLRANPTALLTIPTPSAVLYANVLAAGGKNFVTLAFNNKFCGQSANSGGAAFPDNPMLIAEFAAYAAAVAKQVPALGGLSIWNELNGTWKGGYKNDADKLANYCRLSNAVIAEVRKVNAKLPIAIGATVGWNISGWFIDMFDTYGCVGKGDPTIWLDVHPYISGKIDKAQHKNDWTLWNEAVARIRADGITNPLAATEWGAKSYFTWQSSHPDGDYVKTFQNRVTTADSNWATFIWFEMLYDKAMPNAGLFDQAGELTPVGVQYVDDLRR